MARLKYKDIQDILKIFEIEIGRLTRVGKVEKMKLRKKIANVVVPALSMKNLKTKTFMMIIEDKLGDVLDVFLDGWAFRKKLSRLISQKSKE